MCIRDQDVDWSNEQGDESQDVNDESATYLEFLSQQASKYSAADGEIDDDDDLEEENLLETPLDKVEPYGLLKSSLMRKCSKRDST